MSEYQRGLEAAAKKVKELWHHPYADELAAAIRGLTPQPEPNQDFKVAYGKLFNENAALTGWLEEADAKLASLGYYRQGAGYVLIEDND